MIVLILPVGIVKVYFGKGSGGMTNEQQDRGVKCWAPQPNPVYHDQIDERSKGDCSQDSSSPQRVFPSEPASHPLPPHFSCFPLHAPLPGSPDTTPATQATNFQLFISETKQSTIFSNLYHIGSTKGGRKLN